MHPVSPEEEYAEDALTIPANLAGICAASVPAGSVDGMPVGIQLFARRLGEDTLASAMRQVESTLLR
jgi:aspartyl-tRNA(Asn)/glutamyl-tRNA(Gln) amidotransferase subunit A